MKFRTHLGDRGYWDAELVCHPLDDSSASIELAPACSLDKKGEGELGCPYPTFAALGARSGDRLCAAILRLVDAVEVNIGRADTAAKACLLTFWSIHTL